ncbi:aldehyde dehydrogenase (NAD) family protein [Synechococcus sp. PCC 7335]|uniref:aldehyde dehydrogenase n=1 Tax=Synechococcus sp. (strain ATCC 29403 / PCC 7335) TaxID=91464 RepID=UPI00017EE082|nr:aldehyde dehydrogenase [Synechococcus sp. PCC 7335]EDX87144.1 aldehyde dehydrogenase (NAD) family protein [Synechococcus sp. PCC 7335]
MTALSARPDSAQNSERSLQDLVRDQRAFFATGKTKPLDYRLEQLNKLREAITARQDAIIQAAKEDLGRPEFEGYFEIGVTAELSYVLKRLKSWVKPQKASLPISQLPGSAWVQPEPLGCVLIIGPWNYPFQLVISPLIGAIAAGNCAIIKPSEIAPATSKVVAELISSTFEPNYVAVKEGGVETSQALLAEKFDHIFFTGGTRVGQIVMEAAAKQLTPVTLELGGKSPCIIDKDVNVKVAAKRIAWGKYLNAGQTCVAPDYLLVHSDIKTEFVEALRQVVSEFYGDDPLQSQDFSRLVSDRQFDRVASLIEGEEIVIGGQTDRNEKFVAPTLLNNVSWDAPVMQEEIFGPILPILEYQNVEEAIAQIAARPKPLALYLFSNSRSLQEKVLASTSSGGVCINDVFLHVAIWGMPFGGVGDSGIGAYHGKTSFDTFSHMKSILRKPFWLDIDWRYPPYAKKLDFFKKIVSLS